MISLDRRACQLQLAALPPIASRQHLQHVDISSFLELQTSFSFLPSTFCFATSHSLLRFSFSLLAILGLRKSSSRTSRTLQPHPRLSLFTSILVYDFTTISYTKSTLHELKELQSNSFTIVSRLTASNSLQPRAHIDTRRSSCSSGRISTSAKVASHANHWSKLNPDFSNPYPRPTPPAF